MTFRIFATCHIGEEALERLRAKGWELEVYPELEPPPRELLLDRVRSGIDALVTTLRDPIDEEVLAAGAAAGLKIVAQMAVGFDNIDRAAANRHGIPFSNTADVLTDATAEFALFMLGCVARKTWPSEQEVRELRWAAWHPWHPFLGDEVSGKTLAVIGTGRIGKALINKAVGLDLDVLCHSPAPDERFLDAVRRVQRLRHTEGLCARLPRLAYTSLDDALRRADFVSLHVNLTRPGESAEPTFHLMNAERIALLRPTAYLINTSRGAVVDEAALAEALLHGRLAGAALDVFEREPLPPQSPLRDQRLTQKLRLFHHFASAARATRLSPDPEVGMAGRAVQAVIDVLERRYDGDPRRMPYVVNREGF